MCERRNTGGPIRQLSLQQSPATASRHPLKKQQSVDAVRLCASASSNVSGDISLRVTATSMRTGGHFPQEPITSRPRSGTSHQLPQDRVVTPSNIAVSFIAFYCFLPVQYFNYIFIFQQIALN